MTEHYYYPILSAAIASGGPAILVAIIDPDGEDKASFNVWEYQDGVCAFGRNVSSFDGVVEFVADCKQRWAAKVSRA